MKLRLLVAVTDGGKRVAHIGERVVENGQHLSRLSIYPKKARHRRGSGQRR
jgi:hypothetical protein